MVIELIKEFIQRRKIVLILIGIVLFSIICFLALPRFLDVFYAIVEPHYEKGVYEYYDVAMEYMQTSEKMKEKYGEDFTFYFVSMKYSRDYTNNEGEAEVDFWIKGRRQQTIYLEWQEDEWVIVDKPKKWRD